VGEDMKKTRVLYMKEIGLTHEREMIYAPVWLELEEWKCKGISNKFYRFEDRTDHAQFSIIERNSGCKIGRGHSLRMAARDANETIKGLRAGSSVRFRLNLIYRGVMVEL
jgi:hypothetical protein